MKTDTTNRVSKLWPRVSLGIITFGVLLMMVVMYMESEPGLLPLSIIAFGIVLYFFTRGRRSGEDE